MVDIVSHYYYTHQKKKKKRQNLQLRQLTYKGSDKHFTSLIEPVLKQLTQEN